MVDLKKLEQLLTEGKISRREFIARMSALGLAAAVSPALLPRKAEAAVPKKGGHFKHALTGGSTTDTLDPATRDYGQSFGRELVMRKDRAS